MMDKQLIVVVEGTAAMGRFWKTISSDYLDKMIRSFYEDGSTAKEASAANVGLSLVAFNAHGSISACVVQRGGWTRDIDMFFQWLSAIPFSGGGFNDVAVAGGLAEALMMFSSLNGSQTEQNMIRQRHCILIAASNPYPIPTPVYCPHFQLSDAETVAKAFPQRSVSLSIICPRQLPKLRAIYNAGKCDPQAADPPIDTSKNPNFLVLISENFFEACAAFSRPEIASSAPNQSPVDMDMSSVSPASVTPATSNPAGIGQIAQSSVPPSTFTSTPGMCGTSTLNMSECLSNIQGGVSAGSQTAPVMSRGNLPESQMMQGATGTVQNVPIGMDAGMPSGTGTMMPTTRMAQQEQPGMQLLGMTSSTLANIPLTQQQTSASLPSAQPKYIKVWEGYLSTTRHGEPVLISRLKGYRSASTSKPLAANWPPTLEIVRLVSEEHMNNYVRQYIGKPDFLVFWAMDQHDFLNQLQEQKICGVVQLASVRLVLSVSDKPNRLIGRLLPRIPSEQLQSQHPQLQLQQQSLSNLQQQQELPQMQQDPSQLTSQGQVSSQQNMPRGEHGNELDNWPL